MVKSAYTVDNSKKVAGSPTMAGLTTFLSVYWRALVTIIIPLITLPLIFIGPESKYKCMYVVANMAVFWITEALPLPVTSCIPIFAFPLLGILDTETTCMQYFKETNVMFFGGVVIALCIEYSNLHNRIAMVTILKVGCSPRRLHFGLMIMTTFISMWVSNTAAAAMMCPIITAVLKEMESQGIGKMYVTETNENGEEEERPTKITLCYFIGAAFAASIGGIGTLVGTGTNLTFKGLYEGQFADDNGVTPEAAQILFSKWMMFAVPAVVIITVLNWLWLQYVFMGFMRPKSEEAKIVQMGVEHKDIAHDVIKGKYMELGPITWHEFCTGALFLFAIGLWFFRNPGFMPGWAGVLATGNVKPSGLKDATSALFVIFLMFVIPAKLTFLDVFSTDPEKRPTAPSQSLITWKYIQQKMPWGLIFLLGGGFALAKGSKDSGMSAHLGSMMSHLEVLPLSVSLIIVIVFTQFLTEFSSNVAIANIVIPVLLEMSKAMKVHPLYFTLPASLSCSFAFMTPVGTPPNALVAGLGNIKTKDMAKAGIGTKLITLVIVMILWMTYGVILYNINEFPDFARQKSNGTLTTAHA